MKKFIPAYVVAIRYNMCNTFNGFIKTVFLCVSDCG